MEIGGAYHILPLMSLSEDYSYPLDVDLIYCSTSYSSNDMVEDADWISHEHTLIQYLEGTQFKHV